MTLEEARIADAALRKWPMRRQELAAFINAALAWLRERDAEIDRLRHENAQLRDAARRA